MTNVPRPQTGVLSPYGMVPGALSAINMPTPGQDLSAVVPGLTDMNAAASGDILGELSGNLSPATLAALRNAAATWSVGSGTGMGPAGLGGLGTNKLFGNVAGFAEEQVNKGFQHYNQTIPTISGTQTLAPGLQLQGQQFNTEIAGQNALNAAAPNPAMAQSYAQQLFQNYLQSMRSPSGATAGRMSATGGSSQITGEAPGAWQRGTGPEGGISFASGTAPNYGDLDWSNVGSAPADSAYDPFADESIYQPEGAWDEGF